MAENESYFTLKLRDFITSPLQKVAQAASAVGNAFERSQAKIASQAAVTSAKISQVGTTFRTKFAAAYDQSQYLKFSIDELRTKLQEVNQVRFGTVLKSEFQSANREAKKLEREIHRLESGGGRFRMWFNDALTQLPGAGLFRNPLVYIGAFIGKSISAGMEQQRQRIFFETMVGNKQSGDTLFSGVQHSTAAALYGQKNTQQAAAMLLNFGMTAKEVMPTITALGDVAGNNANHFNRLTLAMGEVQDMGHLTGQQLRQFERAGLNPLQELTKMTGKSTTFLAKAMKAGAISADMVTKAIQHAIGPGGRFHDMMNRMAATASGQWSILKNNFGLAIANLGEKQLPVVNVVLKALNATLSFVTKNINIILAVLVPLLALWIASKTAVMAYNGVMLVTRAATLATTAAQWLLNTAMAANPVALVVMGLVALGIWLYHVWQKSESFRMKVMSLWYVLKGFAGMIKDLVIGRIMELLDAVGKVGQALARLFKGDFGGAWSSAKDAAKDIAGVHTMQRARADYNALQNGAMDKWERMGRAAGKASFEASKRANAASGTTPSGQVAAGKDKSLIDQLNGGKAKGGKGSGGGINGGGPRVVNISINKMLEKLEIHAVTSQQGIRQMEVDVKEALYRILYSANAMQGV